MNSASWRISLYIDRQGRVPVEKWANSLSKKEKAHFFKKVELLSDFGTTLKEPHVKKIEGKLWELRIRLSRRAFRVFYFVKSRNEIVLLHGIVKSTKKTPRREIDVALRRLEDCLHQVEIHHPSQKGRV